jgi:23S rRNA (uracil1939-C5)-methyltransferase
MAKPRKGDILDIEIAQVDEKGQGLGSFDGYSVRVRGAIPGDVVRGYIRNVVNRQRVIELKKTDLLSSANDRILARCSHFGTCGGCVWQDISYPNQVAIKGELVKKCLVDSGIDLEMDDPVGMDPPFFYRNKMEFSFGLSEDGCVAIGLHIPGRFDHIFDLDACYLQSEFSNKIVAHVRDFARQRKLSVYNLKTHEGLLRFLTIREGKNTGETMVVLTTTGEAFPGAIELCDSLRQKFEGVTCFIHSINDRKAQVAFGDTEIALSERQTISENLADLRFDISPSSFFQTNTKQAERLYQRVVAIADPQRTDRVLDLYCGMGGISFFLAKEVDHVLGIEVSDSAIQDAIRNSSRNGILNCSFIAGPAEDVLRQLAKEEERFDLVVTDPPRVGMHPRAMLALLELRPRKIVYVSCNPQALGRDLKILSGSGYKPDYGQLVDMFPHTPHCEVIVRLVDGQ